MEDFSTTVRKTTLTMFAALTLLAAGCGDGGFFQNGGGMLGSALSRQIAGRMDDGEVELNEYTSCDVTQSKDPEAVCAGVSGTQVEVFIDGRSLVFDFSNVTKDGKISDVDFEGYVLSVADDAGLPPILEAIVDATRSSIEAQDLDVQFDDKNVAVNFQGLDYDAATFVKIDLVFDEAS